MDKIKEFGKRYGWQTAAVTGALLTGTLAYKIVKGSDPEYGGVDAHFKNQNLALHQNEANERGLALKNVKYELFLTVSVLNVITIWNHSLKK